MTSRFKVTIKEISERVVYIDAVNAEVARDVVERQYYDGEHVLDIDDYVNTEFIVEGADK